MATATKKNTRRRGDAETQREVAEACKGLWQQLWDAHAATHPAEWGRRARDLLGDVPTGKPASAEQEQAAMTLLEEFQQWKEERRNGVGKFGRGVPPGATSTVTPAGIARHDPDAMHLQRGIVLVSIESLIVDHDRRRCLNQDRVHSLAESLKENGVLQPVGVRLNDIDDNLYRLVWGAHRVAAAESLGWTEIPAVVGTWDDSHAELAEIDENLIRSPLSALEESQALARRKEIYEALHPETKRGAKGGRKQKSVERWKVGTDAQELAIYKRQLIAELEEGHRTTVWKEKARSILDAWEADEITLDNVQNARMLLSQSAPGEDKQLDHAAQSNSSPKSFVKDTADKTGKHPGTVARQAKLGKEIPDAIARKVAKVKAVADSPKELAKLAKLAKSDPEKAGIVADMLKSGECKTVTEALAGEEDSPRRQPSQKPAAVPGKGATGSASALPGTPENTGKASGTRADEPAGAGLVLRQELDDLLCRWRESWGEEATLPLAACVLDNTANELRDQFANAVAPLSRRKPR